MTLEKKVLDIFKTAKLHAKANVDSEKMTFDGLQLAIGNLNACECLVRFNEKYSKRHGGYLDHAIVTQSQAHLERYATKRNLVWNRYALRMVYLFDNKGLDYHHKAQENKLKRYQSGCHFDDGLSRHPAPHKIHVFP